MYCVPKFVEIPKVQECILEIFNIILSEVAPNSYN